MECQRQHNIYCSSMRVKIALKKSSGRCSRYFGSLLPHKKYWCINHVSTWGMWEVKLDLLKFIQVRCLSFYNGFYVAKFPQLVTLYSWCMCHHHPFLFNAFLPRRDILSLSSEVKNAFIYLLSSECNLPVNILKMASKSWTKLFTNCLQYFLHWRTI